MDYESVFLSDVHLGSKYSNPKDLARFLNNYKFKNIFIVGDLLDFFVDNFIWDKYSSLLIENLIELSENNVNIIYVIGNHDKKLSTFGELNIGKIKFCNEYYYTTKNNARLKILHGDKFDWLAFNRYVLAFFGSIGYGFIPFINKITHKFSKNFSLSLYLKKKTNRIFRILTNYEKMMISEIKHSGVDGVIYGHTHFPELKTVDQNILGNCGCWTADTVNTCITEDKDGKLELQRVNYEGKII